MGQGSATLHETAESLSPALIDRHRAIQSLMEELEAVDWYDQRVAACTDDELRSILAHNRDEEKEHAMMVLEWLRRQDPVLDKHMKTYLFTEGSLIGLEKADEGKDDAGEGKAPRSPRAPRAPIGANGAKGSLSIGSLRGAVEK
jgi:ferritin-like protein